MSELEDYLNSIQDEQIVNEMKSVFDTQDIFNAIGIDENDVQNCSVPVDTLLLPTISGLSFFQYFTTPQMPNIILPDLFRICFLLPPSIFKNPGISALTCPKFSFSNNFTASNNRVQKLIPVDVIQSFMYFGYSTDINKNNPIFDLNIRIKSITKNEESIPDRFYNVENIFNTLFDENTILYQLLKFNDTLELAKNQNIDGTLVCNYELKWLYSYYCYSKSVKGSYTTFNNIGMLKYLSYADLTILNLIYENFTSSVGFSQLFNYLENNLTDNIYKKSVDELVKLLNVTSKNNIFICIKIASDLKNYIYTEIQNIISKKEYCKEKFTSLESFEITKKLYDNYSQNEKFVNPYI